MSLTIPWNIISIINVLEFNFHTVLSLSLKVFDIVHLLKDEHISLLKKKIMYYLGRRHTHDMTYLYAYEIQHQINRRL